MKVITETRMLPYNFTAEEHLENSAEMARLYDQLSELEATHKQIKTSLKEEADALLANLGRIARFVRDKRDYRKTACRWIMDCPEVGRKTLRREDTDTDIEVTRMEEHEKQESLNLQPTTDDLPLTEAGGTRVDMSPGKPATEKQIYGDGADQVIDHAPVESSTLASAREADGGTHAKRSRKGLAVVDGPSTGAEAAQ